MPNAFEPHIVALVAEFNIRALSRTPVRCLGIFRVGFIDYAI